MRTYIHTYIHTYLHTYRWNVIIDPKKRYLGLHHNTKVSIVTLQVLHHVNVHHHYIIQLRERN